MQKLLDSHACSGCHALDKRVVGPSFKEISEKYRNDAKASGYLAGKIRSGGQGAWGQVPMPPNAAVPDADVQALVKWILTQK